MATIHLSSNIVNLFYILLFDVIMPTALTWFIAILLSSTNLKIIHDDRKVLWLRQTPFPHLFNRGVSTRLIGLAVALASGLVVILPIVGSFSINGVSTRTSRRVSHIVDGVTPGDVLDLSQQVHRNETGVHSDSTYWAVYWGIECFSIRRDSSVAMFSSFIDTETPESEWTSDFVRSNLKCRIARNGVETKVAVNISFSDASFPWSHKCDVTVPAHPEGSLAQDNTTLRGECPFRVLEFFCTNTMRFFCAGWIEIEGKIRLLVKEFPKTSEISPNNLLHYGKNFVEEFTFSEKPPTESLRSTVHLVDGNFATLAVPMSLITMKRRGTIRELRTEEETVVNETLLIATIAPALSITFGVALGACISRHLYRTKPGRSEYNPFRSATGMLSCALNEAKSEGNGRVVFYKSCFVKTLDGEPYLVQEEDERDSNDEI